MNNTCTFKMIGRTRNIGFLILKFFITFIHKNYTIFYSYYLWWYYLLKHVFFFFFFVFFFFFFFKYKYHKMDILQLICENCLVAILIPNILILSFIKKLLIRITPDDIFTLKYFLQISIRNQGKSSISFMIYDISIIIINMTYMRNQVGLIYWLE